MSHKNSHLEKARRRTERELHKTLQHVRQADLERAIETAKLKELYRNHVVYGRPLDVKRTTPDAAGSETPVPKEEALALIRGELIQRLGATEAEAFFTKTYQEAGDLRTGYEKTKTMEAMRR
jgi:hypothetical protein